jgi:DNA polymerase elongation subunit (family B)
MQYLRLVDSYYTVAEDGYRIRTPIVHLFGRDTSYQRHHIRIDDFRPSFCVPESEWAQKGQQFADSDRILRVETEDHEGNPETSINGRPLVRLVCREPDDVSTLRDYFEDPHEADVLFPVRHLVDSGIVQWFGVTEDALASDGPISNEEIHSVDDDDLPDQTPPPRVVTYDIEVRQGGRGPPVVSEEGTEQARNPVTAISAHDSYTDDYEVWVLAHQSWDVDDADAARNAVECPVHILGNARSVVGSFFEWVVERNADCLMGWNASSFDHPYLVNWALQNNVQSVYDLSPTGTVYDMAGDGSFINSSLKGRLLLDLMTLYEKTELGELDSKRLADVADTEGVSVGKLDIDDQLDVPDDQPSIDFAWKHDPETFVTYALRDTQAAVAINNESKENVNIV